MIMLDQLRAHLLAMLGGLFKDERHRILTDVKDPCASTHAVALGKGFQHAVNRLFIGVEPSKDAMVTSTKFTAAFPTTVKPSAMRPVITNQLKVLLAGLTAVRTLQLEC